MKADGFRARVLGLIACIPAGQVATYGQIAALAGFPRRARHVGQTLAGLGAGHGLPWHRVITASGRVATRRGDSPPQSRRAEGRQERLLRREGLVFRAGRVELKRYRWEPEMDANWPASEENDDMEEDEQAKYQSFKK